jgi:hypothetical protein
VRDTQHVLAAIDGALSDWTVSGDTMRWTPGPPTPVVSVAPSPFVPDPHLAMLGERFVRAFQQAAEAIGRAFQASDGAIERLSRALADLDEDNDPHDEASAEDPRSRALRLLQHRGTGPDRDVVRQRRPRQHALR